MADERTGPANVVCPACVKRTGQIIYKTCPDCRKMESRD